MNSFDGNGQNTNDRWNRELGFEVEVLPEPGPALATLAALASLTLLARRRS
jgi:MYXO-CTERM domain-containing protein